MLGRHMGCSNAGDWLSDEEGGGDQSNGADVKTNSEDIRGLCDVPIDLCTYEVRKHNLPTFLIN